jgi:hypothetical protein
LTLSSREGALSPLEHGALTDRDIATRKFRAPFTRAP